MEETQIFTSVQANWGNTHSLKYKQNIYFKREYLMNISSEVITVMDTHVKFCKSVDNWFICIENNVVRGSVIYAIIISRMRLFCPQCMFIIKDFKQGSNLRPLYRFSKHPFLLGMYKWRKRRHSCFMKSIKSDIF